MDAGYTKAEGKGKLAWLSKQPRDCPHLYSNVFQTGGGEMGPVGIGQAASVAAAQSPTFRSSIAFGDNAGPVSSGEHLSPVRPSLAEGLRHDTHDIAMNAYFKGGKKVFHEGMSRDQNIGLGMQAALQHEDNKHIQGNIDGQQIGDMCEEGVGRGSKLVQLESSRMQALLESQFNPEKMRDPKVVAEPYKPTRKLVEPPTVKEPPERFSNKKMFTADELPYIKPADPVAHMTYDTDTSVLPPEKPTNTTTVLEHKAETTTLTPAGRKEDAGGVGGGVGMGGLAMGAMGMTAGGEVRPRTGKKMFGNFMNSSDDLKAVLAPTRAAGIPSGGFRAPPASTSTNNIFG